MPPAFVSYGPGATLAQDLEPEYIAVSHDSKTAWVTLQENNAMAILDIEAGVFTQLVGLGFKDHSQDGNGYSTMRVVPYDCGASTLPTGRCLACTSRMRSSRIEFAA